MNETLKAVEKREFERQSGPVELKSSTLIGNAKATFSQGKINDERIMAMITEAARGSEYSLKEDKKTRECEYKVKKYKAKIACMKAIPQKWHNM